MADWEEGYIKWLEEEVMGMGGLMGVRISFENGQYIASMKYFKFRGIGYTKEQAEENFENNLNDYIRLNPEILRNSQFIKEYRGGA
jgi:hypothetical protein